MNTKVNNGLIAKNTLMLFFRMLLNIAIQLYSFPIVLKALGVEDYGLYNVIGSIMAMVSLVSFIASGCQRFFAYSIGRGDYEQLRKMFNSTVTIYFIITVVVFIFLEIIGIWFMNNKMQIPPGRLIAAHWVFQLSAISFLVTLMAVPYGSLIIAHEKMNIYAYIGIVTSILKLLAAIAIVHVSYDRLIFYAFFILLIQLFERIYNQIYCIRHFKESRHWKLEIDKKLIKEILIYSGFNIIGAIAITVRKQGMNVVMNLFFGTILNAAHGIALQIQGLIEQLVNNIYQASRPQITKSFAMGDIDEMWRLVFRTSLLSYYLIMILSVIAVFELPTVLSFWLSEVPKYTVNICRVFVFCILLETISNQLIGVFQAMNKIKNYQVSSSVLLLLNIPVAYFLLKHNSTDVMTPYYVQIAISILYVISIICISCKVSHMKLDYFILHVFLREIVITFVVALLVYYQTSLLTPSLLRVFITTVTCIIISGIFILAIGFDKQDLRILRSKLSHFDI